MNTDLCRYLESGAPGQGAGGLSLEELGRWSLATEGAGLAAVTWWEGEERYPMGAAVRAPAWPEGPPQWIHLGDWPRREYGDGETDG